MESIVIRHAGPDQTTVADWCSGETEVEIGAGIENFGGL